MDYLEQIDALLEEQFLKEQELVDALVDVDPELHGEFIDNFEKEKEEVALKIEEINQKIQKEFDKENAPVIEEEPEEEEVEPSLLDSFYQVAKESKYDSSVICKKYKESQLILIGIEAGFEWDKKGTKKEKVELLLKTINK